MAKNRLHLDFNLETERQRIDFLNTYLPTLDFTPNERELEIISDYILWGKDEDGKRDGPKKWVAESTESIEGILEAPGGAESSFKNPYDITNRTFVRRSVFSRTETRAQCDPSLLSVFEDLWARIDQIEYIIAAYDIKYRNRAKPIRTELVNRLGDACATLDAKVDVMPQYDYLKYKHLLVELRQEQYELKDTYTSKLQNRSFEMQDTFNSGLPDYSTLNLQEDVTVFPFLYDDREISTLIFDEEWPEPQSFSEAQLRILSAMLCEPQKTYVIDMTDPAQMLECLKLLTALKSEQNQSSFFQDCTFFARTLEYYIDMSELNDCQREILQLRLNNKSNKIIADIVNPKYNKSYSQNYISTILYNKIIPSICDAARHHYEVVENLFYPELYKTCIDCKRNLLMEDFNFNRLTKSSTGFGPRCRACAKKKQQRGPKYEIIYTK